MSTITNPLQLFKSWCDQNQKYKGYAENIERWAAKKSNKDGWLVGLLPAVDRKLMNKVQDILIADALAEKYKHYKKAERKYLNNKNRINASKKGNTADNLVSHLHKYFLFIAEQLNGSQATPLSNAQEKKIKERVDSFIMVKDNKELLTKIKSSLETQNRVYPNMRQGNYMSFPISLINKILGGRKNLKDWENRIIEKLKVFIDTNEKHSVGLGNIIDMSITPYKNVMVRVRDKKGKEHTYTVKTRADDNSPLKTMKVATFADISIGHMPPISEVIQKLLSTNPNALPGLQELTDIIVKYCNSKSLSIDAVTLKKEYQNIYKECNSSWTDDLKEKITEDMKEIDSRSEYELQDRSENSSMGGINRKP